MKTIHTIFENGVFRPEEPVAIAEGTRIDIAIPDDDPPGLAALKARHASSYGTLTQEEAAELMGLINDESDRNEVAVLDDPPGLAALKRKYACSFGTMTTEEADELSQIVHENFGQIDYDGWVFP